MTEMARPRPAEEVEIVARRFGEDGHTPNHPELPALLYRRALGGETSPDAVEALLERCGWTGTWTWEVYDFEHYHTRSHEVLVVARGGGRLLIGGPNGWRLDAQAGDALVLPAGTGHRQLEKEPGFAVCGAYPPGQAEPDIVRDGTPPDAAARERIRGVPRPETDPLYGKDGPLLRAWR